MRKLQTLLPQKSCQTVEIQNSHNYLIDRAEELLTNWIPLI